MDFRLIQNQTQKLVLTPQIQQYLRLLQQPLTELLHCIDQELIENPVLEEVRDKQNTADGDATTLPDDAPANEAKNDELDFQANIDDLIKLDEQYKESYHSQYDTKQESIDELEKKHNFRESLITETESLNDYLNWQLSFVELSEEEVPIADYMVGNISEDGYFRLSIDEIALTFRKTSEHIQPILAKLQSLDPAGIFGRDLREVLMLQLERKDATPQNRLAYKILETEFDLFKKRNYSQLAKNLSCSTEAIQEAMHSISLLEPKPGRIFYKDEKINILPDVTIHQPIDEGDDFIIEIHHENIPQLRISEYYKSLLKDKGADGNTKEYIKQKINSAVWFVKAIEQRKSTLRLITEEIIASQRDFFLKGFAFLKPLKLKDIAEKIDIHESTVSRALSRKYVNTPQGTIPFKSFFSSKMETAQGEDESQKSVMEKLKQIIDGEKPEKPLSDEKLVKLLNEDGIKIARRTVAKYREMMKILPSHLRKLK